MAAAFSSEVSSREQWELVDSIKGAIYGNCVGDAIGLLSEFMGKTQAQKVIL